MRHKQIILRFTHVGKGLSSNDSTPLRGFTIAGDDGEFKPALAIIKGKHIVVSNDDISYPVAVRYGWSNSPDVNLFNLDGLPASPFRTDGNVR